jgi:hypothetical protein
MFKQSKLEEIQQSKKVDDDRGGVWAAAVAGGVDTGAATSTGGMVMPPSPTASVMARLDQG